MEKLNINKKDTLSNYIVLWLGQSISQIGSSMTGFALLIWVYQLHNSVMSVALPSVFSILPYVAVSLFAGALVDKFKKKSIMLICDLVAALCSLSMFILLVTGALEIWYVFIINTILSFMNAFQSPASKVAVGLIVSKEKYTRVSGLRSLTDSLTTIFTPVLATTVIAFWGMKLVLITDMITFVIAFLSLLLLVKIPEPLIKESKINSLTVITQIISGFNFLRQQKGLLSLIFWLSAINFMAAIAFMSILSPMILSRTNNNLHVLGLVKGAIGAGGIIGGIIVSIIKLPNKRANIIFISAAVSFLFGDILMGIGSNLYIWVLAAFAGSLPLPFLNAAETSLLYTKVPKDMQGRVFSVRGSLQFITMPMGYIAGGVLADYIFEPLMAEHKLFQILFGRLVGNGDGSGMGLIFIFTGITGVILSLFGLKNKNIQKLNVDELDFESS